MILTRFLMIVLPVLAVLLQSGCATRLSPAPVVDRSSGRSSEPVEPGYYRVKRGDTLLRIALDHGQSHRDIAEWNNIADPNLIEVDQVIRVNPPKTAKASNTKIEVKQEKPAIAKEAPKPIDRQPNKEEKLAKQEVVPEKAKTDAPTDLGIRLSWPSKGEVIERFDEGKSKGIGIAGKSGDAVQSAADGKVVYAGNSLRGYGNLVIVKHDNTYLTAYAHNKTLLVKEGDMVKKSQKIAEMGNTDADRVKLHFELRKNGKPVDPIAYLP
jgi:lipoprotein NlpD